MGLLLAALFIGVPALEIALLIKVGGAIGAGPTFLLVIATGILGATMAKRQGTRALHDIQRALRSGRQVGSALLSGALLLVAAVLLLTPGLVTDAVGLLLLIPPVRRAVALAVQARLAHRIVVGAVPRRWTRGGAGSGGEGPPPGVIDV